MNLTCNATEWKLMGLLQHCRLLLLLQYKLVDPMLDLWRERKRMPLRRHDHCADWTLQRLDVEYKLIFIKSLDLSGCRCSQEIWKAYDDELDGKLCKRNAMKVRNGNTNTYYLALLVATCSCVLCQAISALSARKEERCVWVDMKRGVL